MMCETFVILLFLRALRVKLKTLLIITPQTALKLLKTSFPLYKMLIVRWK